jgi:hypothetical protein
LRIYLNSTSRITRRWGAPLASAPAGMAGREPSVIIWQE